MGVAYHADARKCVLDTKGTVITGVTVGRYLFARELPAFPTNLHDAGATTPVGASFSGVSLLFVSSVLKPTRSVESIAFQPLPVAVNSLHADSHVSTCAFVGGISIPFCVSGPNTVLKRLLIAANDKRLPGTRAAPPKPPL